MFTFDPKDCQLFKQALQILKTEVVSIRAHKDHVLFCFVNRNTGLMLLHKVAAKVERDQEFGINQDRLIALLTKETLSLNYDGHGLTYKSGRSHGTVETHKAFFEDWPNLKQTGIPVQEVLDEFSFLDLKSKYSEIFIFGGIWNGVACAAAGDSEHGVFMPLTSSTEFALPLQSLHSAQRIFKGGVHVLVDAGTVFFQARSERTRSILRFGQMSDTGQVTLNAMGHFKDMATQWKASVDAALFTQALNDYKLIEDKDRIGILQLESTGTKVEITCKTRHGEASLSADAQGEAGTATLSPELLRDIHKLEGFVKIGVKENGRIFVYENDKASYFCALG